MKPTRFWATLEKRKKYDELGENWNYFDQSGRQPQGNPYSGAQGGRQYYYEGDEESPFGGGESGFSDFFEQFFGGGSRSGAKRGSGRRTDFKGGDYQTEMEITLEEAYQGIQRLIQLETEKLRITTKPGAYDGQLLKIKGKGAPGSSADQWRFVCAHQGAAQPGLYAPGRRSLYRPYYRPLYGGVGRRNCDYYYVGQGESENPGGCAKRQNHPH